MTSEYENLLINERDYFRSELARTKGELDVAKEDLRQAQRNSDRLENAVKLMQEELKQSRAALKAVVSAPTEPLPPSAKEEFRKSQKADEKEKKKAASRILEQAMEAVAQKYARAHAESISNAKSRLQAMVNATTKPLTIEQAREAYHKLQKVNEMSNEQKKPIIEPEETAIELRKWVYGALPKLPHYSVVLTSVVSKGSDPTEDFTVYRIDANSKKLLSGRVAWHNVLCIGKFATPDFELELGEEWEISTDAPCNHDWQIAIVMPDETGKIRRSIGAIEPTRNECVKAINQILEGEEL